MMSAHHTGWWAWVALLIAATLMTGAAAAETIVKFSLDFRFEGPSAPFLLPLDKGYYKAEGLNVTHQSRQPARSNRSSAWHRAITTWASLTSIP